MKKPWMKTSLVALLVIALTLLAPLACLADESVMEKYPLITDPNINEPGTYPIANEMAKLSIGVVQNGSVITYAYGENFYTTFMQDKTNIALDIELFPATDASQKLELMVNSNAKLPDILIQMGIENDITRYSFAQAGAIIPLDEYFDQLGIEVRRGAELIGPTIYEDALKYTRSPDGHVYGIPEWDRAMNNHYTNRAWINQTFLDALGLEMPETQEDLLTVLRAFRDGDPNGNGKKDEIPMTAAIGSNELFRWLLNMFMYSDAHTNYYTAIEDGKLDVAYDKDEWRDCLRFGRMLVEEGLIVPQSFTQDGTQLTALASSDPQIVGVGVALSVTSMGSNMPDYFGIGALKGDNGAQWTTYRTQAPYSVFAITKDCENPALAFLFGTSGYADELLMITRRYGIPDTDWEYVQPEENAAGMYEFAGYPAYMRQINQVWGVPHQSSWNGMCLPKFNRYELSSGMAWDGNQSNSEYKQAEVIERFRQYAPDPSTLFVKNIYTLEELEETNEYRASLLQYVNESIALFMMGTMDIEKDWDSYLKELEKLHYKEILAIDQEAYTRTQAN